MRVLLDECLPRRLKRHLPGHEVSTVTEEGWAGRKNGDLLRIAAGRFDVLVTADKGQPHQQDIRALPLGVIVLRARTNRLESLLPLVPGLLAALASVRRGAFMEVRGPGQ
jgi:predicted nuclease of predicted toxin-antitoxin system